jgi:carbamoyltransferase
VRCLQKQFWDGSHTQPKGLGTFYARLTQCLFPGIGNEGIVMGLAPYGDAMQVNLPPLDVRDGHVHIPQPWIDLFNNASRYSFFIDGNGTFKDAADLASAGQRAYEKALLKCAEWLYKETGFDNLIIVGGCGLNCSANAKVLKHSSFKNVFVPPATHDGGTSLGCAIYGMIEVLHKPNEFKWEADALGPMYDIEAFANSLANHVSVEVEKPSDISEVVAEALTSGEVLGVYQGGSEFGPRALGHRSIIADPRNAFITNYINDKIKKRQWFRPLSPMVLDDDKQRYFNFNRCSPFMLFAVEVKPEAKKLIPAVVHVDDSARIQTITEANNPFFYDLISRYKVKTGVSVILNTSFNGKAEPIVETPDDALNCFLSTPLNKLVMPPYIIHKKRKEKNPLLT